MDDTGVNKEVGSDWLFTKLKLKNWNDPDVRGRWKLALQNGKAEARDRVKQEGKEWAKLDEEKREQGVKAFQDYLEKTLRWSLLRVTNWLMVSIENAPTEYITKYLKNSFRGHEKRKRNETNALSRKKQKGDLTDSQLPINNIPSQSFVHLPIPSPKNPDRGTNNLAIPYPINNPVPRTMVPASLVLYLISSRHLWLFRTAGSNIPPLVTLHRRGSIGLHRRNL